MMPHIGVDIVDIERFRGYDPVRDRAFLETIFTNTELKYCFGTEDPAPHLAVRFAAKEAVVKALAFSGLKRPQYSEIEVIRNKNGAPTLHIQSTVHGVSEAQVSLSHANNVAVAAALLIV